jgi:hypothetical protein
MNTFAQEPSRRNGYRPSADPLAPLLIAEWPIKRGEIARVSIENYKGTWLISLRKWFEADDSQLRPGKGISLSVKHLPRVSAAMEEALAEARNRGLISADDREGNR